MYFYKLSPIFPLKIFIFSLFSNYYSNCYKPYCGLRPLNPEIYQEFTNFRFNKAFYLNYRNHFCSFSFIACFYKVLHIPVNFNLNFFAGYIILVRIDDKFGVMAYLTPRGHYMVYIMLFRFENIFGPFIL